MATPNGATSMDALDLHLLLATSGQENILLQLEQLDTFKVVTQRIKAFFASPNIKRTVQIVPANLGGSAEEADDILEHLFTSSEEEGTAGQNSTVPQVLVIPYLEDYQKHIQIALKAVLREKRFNFKGQSYNLPNEFLLVGITADRERIASFIINSFGLFLELDDVSSTSNPTSLPPLIPLLPKAYYAPKVRIYAADLLAALRHHPFINNTLLTAQCDFQHLFKITTLWIRLKSFDATLSSKGGETSSDVYERDIELRPADVAEVLSMCVLHRLRTRLPEQRWDSFWNKQPKSEQAQKMDDAIRNGARLRYDLIIEDVLDKV